MDVRFQLSRVRLEFVAREPLEFSAGGAGNILRGALGTNLKSHPAAYSRIFKPVAHTGPSGLIDSPRPFVIRARALDGCSFAAGERFHFDLHVFAADAMEPLIQAFATLADEGIGPRRAKSEMESVRPESRETITLDLSPPETGPSRIRIEFLSPTELKHDGEIAERPEFPILFARIRDRLSTLRALYGTGPLEIDFLGMSAQAEAVRMTRCDLRHQRTLRRSSRTGQTHSIGGFVGAAEYEGELAGFLPYLEAGHWIGVGRQAVWGKGEIATTAPEAEPPVVHR